MLKSVRNRVYSFCLLLVLSSFVSSIAFSYIADFRGGWHIDFPLGDIPDTLSFTFIDIGAYREIFDKFKLGISYNFYDVYASPEDFRWHSFSPEILFFFKEIDERIDIYARGGINLLNTTSSDHLLGTYYRLKVKIKQPSFKAGAGCEVKIIPNLRAYGEVLLNFSSVKFTYGDRENTDTYISLMFGAGASYTLD